MVGKRNKWDTGAGAVSAQPVSAEELRKRAQQAAANIVAQMKEEKVRNRGAMSYLSEVRSDTKEMFQRWIIQGPKRPSPEMNMRMHFSVSPSMWRSTTSQFNCATS
jgi:hypothetical protein